MIDLLAIDENFEIQRKKVSSIEPAFEGKKSINVVFSFNDEYCKYFIVALQSLIDNSKQDNLYDIVIFSSDISNKNLNLIQNMVPENFSVRIFNLQNYLNEKFKSINFKTYFCWSIEMYYRIFIPLIMDEYDRVLYLDTDVVINGDISELFQIEMKDKLLLAVIDTVARSNYYKRFPNRLEFIKKSLKLKNELNYFNSGMLVFNIKKFDKKEYVNRFIKAINIKDIEFPDQDALNAMLEDETIIISSKWNLCCGELAGDSDFNVIKEFSGEYKKDFIESYKNPAIIHYTSLLKPWNSNTKILPEVFWKYAKKTPYYEDLIVEKSIFLTKAENIKMFHQNFLYSKLNSKTKILFWGASLFLQEFLKKFDIKQDNILGIIDNDKTKQGTKLANYTIFSPEKIKELDFDEVILTIVNRIPQRKKEVENYIYKLTDKKVKVTSI